MAKIAEVNLTRIGAPTNIVGKQWVYIDFGFAAADDGHRRSGEIMVQASRLASTTMAEIADEAQAEAVEYLEEALRALKEMPLSQRLNKQHLDAHAEDLAAFRNDQDWPLSPFPPRPVKDAI